MKTIDITEIKLSNRREYGEYTTWDALSSNGVDTYQVTVNGAGHARGCTCPARVKCIHKKAAEFEFAWTEPVQREAELSTAAAVVACVMPEMAQDMAAHLEDDGIVEDEIEQERAAWAKMTPDERRAAYTEIFGIYDAA